jgi:hypothetical protein
MAVLSSSVMIVQPLFLSLLFLSSYPVPVVLFKPSFSRDLKVRLDSFLINPRFSRKFWHNICENSFIFVFLRKLFSEKINFHENTKAKIFVSPLCKMMSLWMKRKYWYELMQNDANKNPKQKEAKRCENHTKWILFRFEKWTKEKLMMQNVYTLGVIDNCDVCDNLVKR